MERIELEIVAKTDKAKKNIDGLEDSLERLNKTQKDSVKDQQSLGEEVASTGGAMAVLDAATDGLATRVRDGVEAFRLMRGRLQEVTAAQLKANAAAIAKALEKLKFRHNSSEIYSAQSFDDNFINLPTKGAMVGQINGLTVIDTGDYTYGEPARITTSVHYGDGEVADIERKSELGGNIHAKGMMIMQAFVSSALNLEDPLPYAASVVFEQSYCEVDGDSASLAELCSLVSALSEYPINQHIAVTGAVDQFGRVQAVGGLNEKIEGFYHVCKHNGLTGEQGVILPKSNLRHLALKPDLIESIKNEEFHIWSVSNVDEAIPLIMNKPFRDDEEESVLSKIAERIENFERHEHPPGIVERIKNWFV